MKICVQGLWHLGSVTAACLASIGHNIVGLDFNAATVAALNRGEPPVLEPGLADLVKSGLAAGTLHFTTAVEDATKDIEVLWVTYDTPVDDDDNADVGFVISEIERVLPALAPEVTVLISSQMPVGSVRRLERLVASSLPAARLSFACSPENLRLGKALDVFLKPDRIIAGVRSEADREKLSRMLRPITERIEWMSVESAEMTKHAINAFLATSVTFANEIAAICEVVGADAKEVERGLKTEARIGPKAYLSPGGAFAGGTLARDITYLNLASAEKSLSTPLLSSVKPSNDEHKLWIRRKLQACFPRLSGVTIAVWGLTYKPGTDTLRRSIAVELCDWCLQQGMIVQVHDPVVKELPAQWQGKVRRFPDPIASIGGAQVLAIATEWPLYRDVSWGGSGGDASLITVLDANRFVPGLGMMPGVRYIAVGTPDRLE
jgi:UDPglucose 6-dehydrogenase